MVGWSGQIGIFPKMSLAAMGGGAWKGSYWRQAFTMVRGGMGGLMGSDRGHPLEERDLRGIWGITRSL